MVTMAKTTAEDELAAAEAQEYRDILATFRAKLGSSDEGKCQIWRRNPVTKKMGYLATKPFSKDSDDIQAELRADYEDGGEFKLVLLTREGKYLATESFELEPLPEKLRTPPAAKSKPSGEEMPSNMMMLFMKMQQDSADRQQQMVVQMMNSMAQMVGKSPQESPTEGLKNMIEIHKALNEKSSGGGLKETLELLVAAREILGAGDGGDGGGFAGLIKQLVPVLAQAASGGQQAQQPQQPQMYAPQVPQPGYQVQPPRAPANEAAPAAAVPDAPQSGQDQQNALRQMYGPLIAAVKRLVESGREAEGIVGFLEDQIDAGFISGQAVEMLVTSVMADPMQLPLALASFGVTDPAHVEVISDAIRLYADNLADPEPETGTGRDAPVSQDHETKRAS